MQKRLIEAVVMAAVLTCMYVSVLIFGGWPH